MSNLGFCASCAAAVINPSPILGEWNAKRIVPCALTVAAVIGLVIWWRSR